MEGVAKIPRVYRVKGFCHPDHCYYASTTLRCRPQGNAMQRAPPHKKNFLTAELRRAPGFETSLGIPGISGQFRGFLMTAKSHTDLLIS
eukprot:4427535-Amphidinium_carterae.1